MSTTVNSIAPLQPLTATRPIRRKRKRTNEEKRREVIALLLDERLAEFSDRVLAQQAKVSAPYVGELRRILSKNILTVRITKRRGADGVLRNTSKIGKRFRVTPQQRELVLAAIHQGIWTIKELMEEANLSRPKVQFILDALVDADIVGTASRKTSTGGRPETLYYPVPNTPKK